MSNAKELFELTEKAVTAQQILLKYIENKDRFREVVDTALDGIEDEKSKARTLTTLISYTLTKESEIETDDDWREFDANSYVIEDVEVKEELKKARNKKD